MAIFDTQRKAAQLLPVGVLIVAKVSACANAIRGVSFVEKKWVRTTKRGVDEVDTSRVRQLGIPDGGCGELASSLTHVVRVYVMFVH